MPIATSSQAEIDRLRQALDRLENQSRSKETRQLVKNALRSLNSLAEYLETSEEQQRLAALYRVSHLLGASLDIDEVLTQVMDAVIGLTGAERGFLVLNEPEADNWELRAARNLGQETLQRKDMVISDTVIETVMTSGRGVVTTDAQSDPRFSKQASVQLNSLRSILCAPLRVRGIVTGAIYVDHRAHTSLFTPRDLDMLEAFAAQAAIAIENARLYTRTDQALAQRVAELETLAHIDRELNASLDLEHIREIVRHWALQGVQATQVWILIQQELSEEGVIFAAPALSNNDASFGDAFSFLDPLVTLALQEGQPKSLSPAPGQPGCLVVPILHAGQAQGVLVVERPAEFDEVEIQFLNRLAGRAAAAIANARLYFAVQQANQAKTKFISVVAHELRIPMTSIKGYSELLRQGVAGAVNDQQLNYLEVIRSNVDRMATLVSDLSDISRIETGRLKLECSLVSMLHCVNEVVRSMRPRLEEKKQCLKVEIAENLPQVFADPNRVIQVLNNLLSNAWKYTPPEGKIYIAVWRAGEHLRTEIGDTGIGISSEDQLRLFTQFFRSDDPAVRDQQGWGLGLSVSRRLVEIMGGSIGVQSTLGQGTTFWFTLPVGESATLPK